MFKDIRPDLPHLPLPLPMETAEQKQDVLLNNTRNFHEATFPSDLTRFFALFPDGRLVRDIFMLVEDARIDYRIMHEYPGLVPIYIIAQKLSMGERPAIELLPAREAFVEFIVCLSLCQDKGLKIPCEYANAAFKMRELVQQVAKPSVTIEDAAEITIRIYKLLCDIPNTIKTKHAKVYQSPATVAFRGQFKPELAHFLSQMEIRQIKNIIKQDKPILKKQIEILLQQSSEIDSPYGKMPKHLQRQILRDNLMKETAERFPIFHQDLQNATKSINEYGNPLEATGPGTFTYDEWDFLAKAYKSNWCCLHEKELIEGKTDFFEKTTDHYASLLHKIQRQFELMVPEMYHKLKHLEDGEEYDLNAAIEAVVDYRIGKAPSEKLFWRRNKMERNIAVALLLDMSASTSDEVDRIPSKGSCSKKRIIDVEKEAIVLLLSVLEKLKDSCGIYGFSGSGRQNVEFYVIKDLKEEFTPQVAKRIDSIKPMSATRMGPPIRHATAKLLNHEAMSRFLFIISDGRPQDRGYGNESEHRHYAVQDTRKALLEARHQGILPFCLTVDKAGHDYLKTMMQDMNYEVLSDINLLPERLLQLYRNLTT